MTDLLGDLDVYADELDGDGWSNTADACRAAKAEIGRLRAALKSTYGDLQQYVAHGPGSVNLTARLFEIGRLLRDDEQ